MVIAIKSCADEDDSWQTEYVKQQTALDKKKVNTLELRQDAGRLTEDMRTMVRSPLPHPMCPTKEMTSPPPPLTLRDSL